ncbi:glutamine amidotransferase [Phycisphaerales bacterium AB-hyl4]|uniref:Glutamine amidotransferase n=1 Tax=Natronomicrosphaera hydrolytica TaxID=3242702 RepID=A0ABV4U6C9_9BACT
MAKVYYIGDWAIQMGPIYAETPFNYAWKGTDLINYGQWLKDALANADQHDVASVPTWDFYRLPPGGYEDVLESHDVIIFSDVEAKNFQLDPSFFQRERFGKQVLTFPDRVRLTTEAIRRGKGMMFLGGWLSFNGEMGKGGWGRTRLHEVLPVTCLEHEDLVESTEGFTAVAEQPDHPILKGIDLATLPPILGYNRVQPREGCDIIARWRETGDIMLAVGKVDRGRVLAYTSDPAPHWGCNFVFWEQYPRFWENALAWTLGETG